MLLLEDTKCKIGKTQNGSSAKHNNDFDIPQTVFSYIPFLKKKTLMSLCKKTLCGILKTHPAFFI